LFTAQTFSTQGFDIVPRRIQPHRFEADGYRAAATAMRLGWTPLPDTRIEATLRWQQANFGIDRFLANDPNYSSEDRRWSGQVRGETRLFGIWTTGVRVGVHNDRRRAVNLPDQFSASRADDLFRGDRTVVEWGNQVRLPDIGGFAADGAVGFGYNYARETASTASGNAPFRSIVNASQDSHAGFVNLQYRVFGRLDVSAGGRVDNTTGFGATPTYRIGAVYALPEVNARLRAAMGSGFAAPSLFQRFGIIGSSFRGNPDLRPERSTSFELGADMDVGAFGNPRFFTATTTYFRTFFRDLITSNAAFTTNINVARANIEGVELGLTARLNPYVEARAAYTLTRAFDSTTDRRLLRRPENVLALSGRITPLPGLTIAPEIQLTGRSPDFVFDNLGRTSRATNTKAGTTANVTVTYQVRPAVAVFLEGRNLGNSRFEPTSGFVVPGRSVLLGTRFAL
ncbi:MAG: TonB-dependent receptor, partial [Gemmatimonadaceae bacterium]|nr:TonB-dependent receptor [Acetobacteraceae bacterium]